MEGRDVLWAAGGSVVFLAPFLLGVGPDLPHPCAPCDRADVPAFDRWAIAHERPGAVWASHLLVLATLAVPVLDLWNDGDPGRAHAAGLAIAVSWSAASSVWLKNLVRRPRPLLYADPPSADAVREADSRRSFPSTHTAVAAAAAASYFLARRDLDGGTPGEVWMPVGLALGVGVMRITAGKHFPSDVLAGGLFGVAASVVVHQLRSP